MGEELTLTHDLFFGLCESVITEEPGIGLQPLWVNAAEQLSLVFLCSRRLTISVWAKAIQKARGKKINVYAKVTANSVATFLD